MPGVRTAKAHFHIRLHTISRAPLAPKVNQVCAVNVLNALKSASRRRECVNRCVITHAGTSVARAPFSQTYLPLLLLPGGVQQQIPVPVLLLGHVRVFMVDRVGVAVCYLGFDSCHGSVSVRTLRVPPQLIGKNKKISNRNDEDDAVRPKNLLVSRFRGGEGETVRGCRDQTPLVRGACAEVVLPLPEDPAGRCSFPGQKWHT